MRKQKKDGAGKLEAGIGAEKYWFPFPGLRCYPIVVRLTPPDEGFQQVIEYEFLIEE